MTEARIVHRPCDGRLGVWWRFGATGNDVDNCEREVDRDGSLWPTWGGPSQEFEPQGGAKVFSLCFESDVGRFLEGFFA
jgi:hypothetical protein